MDEKKKFFRTNDDVIFYWNENYVSLKVYFKY